MVGDGTQSAAAAKAVCCKKSLRLMLYLQDPEEPSGTPNDNKMSCRDWERAEQRVKERKP
jgi:hypothetical protein